MVPVLDKGNEATDHATVEMLCSLMQPMHPNYELRLEQLNKQSMLASRQFVEKLLQLVVDHVVSQLVLKRKWAQCQGILQRNDLLGQIFATI